MATHVQIYTIYAGEAGRAHHVSSADDSRKRQASAAPRQAGDLIPLDRPYVQRLASELVLLRPFQSHRHRSFPICITMMRVSSRGGHKGSNNGDINVEAHIMEKKL